MTRISGTLSALHAHLEEHRGYYNTQRPHRSLSCRTQHAYTARSRAGPAGTVGGTGASAGTASTVPASSTFASTHD
ncbi:hypothetical protein ACFFGH_27280 [Lysobacter korlensis]|uniref:Integrase catalytic domain-containing protein n=1 Tax=Lysobacter korlensis TaxID=553636 RepID=A0ABV6S079_9GAMM